MNTITIGIDLAKHVFAACELDRSGRVLRRREFRRDGFAAWLHQLPAGTVVAMEACGSAHHWARRCREAGLAPRLIAAHLVTPFRKSAAGKNDRNDAEAIATAARQGNMRFVAIKSVDQQARLAGHRVREGYKTEAIAIANRLRGLLAEFGVVIAQSDAALRRVLTDPDALSELPGSMRNLLDDLHQHWQAVVQRVRDCDARIGQQARADDACRRLQQITGVGPLTADAFVATVGDTRLFANGRQLAAWLGLVPGQHSSGGKHRLGAITGRGDSYLRTLLIQGARSSWLRARAVPHEQATPEQRWIAHLCTRMPFGKVLVAIANKHARQMWAMLARDEAYDPNAWLRHPMVQRPKPKRRQPSALAA